MKTGFIGAGKAGVSLGTYFRDKDIPVTGYYDLYSECSTRAADLTGSVAFSDIEEVLKESDMVFVTTPDGEIEKTAEQIGEVLQNSTEQIRCKYICHLSGSVPSDVLKVTGKLCASSHPMMAISNKHTDLSSARFTLEGDEAAVEELEKIYRQCGNKTPKIRSDRKGLYHCAASVSSNLMVGLASMALRLLHECGLEAEEALDLLGPLMEGNIAAVSEKGPALALTGPVERNDTTTVAKHLDCLEGEQKEVYRLLAKETVRLAESKYGEERSYSQMKKLLEERK